MKSSCRFEMPPGKSTPFEKDLELHLKETGREELRAIKILEVEPSMNPRWLHVQYEKEPGQTRRIWMQPVKLEMSPGVEQWFV